MLFVFRVGKGPLVVSFLLFYAVQTAIRAYVMRHHLPWQTLFLGTLESPPFFLFTFYMITDPATSPKTRRGQVALAFALTVDRRLLHFKESVFTFFYAALAVGVVRFVFLHARALWRGKGARLAALFDLESLQARRRGGRPGAQHARRVELGARALRRAGRRGLPAGARGAQPLGPRLHHGQDARGGGPPPAPRRQVGALGGRRGGHRRRRRRRPARRAGDAPAGGAARPGGPVPEPRRLPLRARPAARPRRAGERPLEPTAWPAARCSSTTTAMEIRTCCSAWPSGRPGCCATGCKETGQLRFEDVSAAAGLDAHTVSLGATFFDFDNDGVLDLFVMNALTTHLPGYERAHAAQRLQAPGAGVRGRSPRAALHAQRLARRGQRGEEPALPRQRRRHLHAARRRTRWACPRPTGRSRSARRTSTTTASPISTWPATSGPTIST